MRTIRKTPDLTSLVFDDTHLRTTGSVRRTTDALLSLSSSDAPTISGRALTRQLQQMRQQNKKQVRKRTAAQTRAQHRTLAEEPKQRQEKPSASDVGKAALDPKAGDLQGRLGKTAVQCLQDYYDKERGRTPGSPEAFVYYHFQSSPSSVETTVNQEVAKTIREQTRSGRFSKDHGQKQAHINRLKRALQEVQAAYKQAKALDEAKLPEDLTKDKPKINSIFEFAQALKDAGITSADRIIEEGHGHGGVKDNELFKSILALEAQIRKLDQTIDVNMRAKERASRVSTAEIARREAFIEQLKVQRKEVQGELKQLLECMEAIIKGIPGESKDWTPYEAIQQYCHGDHKLKNKGLLIECFHQISDTLTPFLHVLGAEKHHKNGFAALDEFVNQLKAANIIVNQIDEDDADDEPRMMHACGHLVEFADADTGTQTMSIIGNFNFAKTLDLARDFDYTPELFRIMGNTGRNPSACWEEFKNSDAGFEKQQARDLYSALALELNYHLGKLNLIHERLKQQEKGGRLSSAELTSQYSQLEEEYRKINLLTRTLQAMLNDKAFKDERRTWTDSMAADSAKLAQLILLSAGRDQNDKTSIFTVNKDAFDLFARFNIKLTEKVNHQAVDGGAAQTYLLTQPELDLLRENIEQTKVRLRRIFSISADDDEDKKQRARALLEFLREGENKALLSDISKELGIQNFNLEEQANKNTAEDPTIVHQDSVNAVAAKLDEIQDSIDRYMTKQEKAAKEQIVFRLKGTMDCFNKYITPDTEKTRIAGLEPEQQLIALKAAVVAEAKRKLRGKPGIEASDLDRLTEPQEILQLIDDKQLDGDLGTLKADLEILHQEQELHGMADIKLTEADREALEQFKQESTLKNIKIYTDTQTQYRVWGKPIVFHDFAGNDFFEATHLVRDHHVALAFRILSDKGLIDSKKCRMKGNNITLKVDSVQDAMEIKQDLQGRRQPGSPMTDMGKLKRLTANLALLEKKGKATNEGERQARRWLLEYLKRQNLTHLSQNGELRSEVRSKAAPAPASSA